jgi:hypothetical protein
VANRSKVWVGFELKKWACFWSLEWAIPVFLKVKNYSNVYVFLKGGSIIINPFMSV